MYFDIIYHGIYWIADDMFGVKERKCTDFQGEVTWQI